MAGESAEVILDRLMQGQLQIGSNIAEIKGDIKEIKTAFIDLHERVGMIEKAEMHHGKRLDAIDGKDGRCETEKGAIAELKGDMKSQATKLTFIVSGIALIATAIINWLFKKL